MNKAYLMLLTLIALPVLADNNKGFYVGLGGAGIDDRQDSIIIANLKYSVDTTAIRTGEVIGGYKYNDALGLEVRVGSSIRPGKGANFAFNALNKPENTQLIERDIGNYQSIYYKPELVNEDAKLYALLGYTKTSSSFTTKNLSGKELSSVSASYSGFSYGVGIGFVIDEHFNINFEYRSFCEDLYDKPNMSSVNIDYRF